MSGFTSNWSIYKIIRRRKKKKQDNLSEEIKQKIKLIDETIR